MFKEKYGYDRVLNIITFKTQKPKSAILTAGRGLGYNNDEIQSIADLIPIERGAQWSLNDCLYGNKESERKPIPEFINLVKEYPNLIDVALDIENLIVGRSIHASGLYIFDENYIKYNSLMKAPNGVDVTCWSMKDSDYCGALKVDYRYYLVPYISNNIRKLRISGEILRALTTKRYRNRNVA